MCSKNRGEKLPVRFVRGDHHTASVGEIGESVSPGHSFSMGLSFWQVGRLLKRGGPLAETISVLDLDILSWRVLKRLGRSPKMGRDHTTLKGPLRNFHEGSAFIERSERLESYRGG